MALFKVDFWRRKQTYLHRKA